MSQPEPNAERQPAILPMPLAEKWIREHGAAYAGQWVALRDDQFVAAAWSFSELEQLVPHIEDVLVTVIE